MNNISEDRKKYLIKRKKEKYIIVVFRIFIITLLLSLWQTLSSFNILNPFLVSSPFLIIKTIIKLLTSNSLLIHIFITIFEIILCFFISIIISFILSSAMWFINVLYKIFDPYLNVLNSIPKVALGPLIIIWAGSGIKSIIIMGLLISVFVTTIDMYNYFSTTNQNFITLLKTFGANKFQIFRYVVIPSNYNNLTSCLKICLSMNYIGVIMGELLVSKRGLGYLINYGSSVFQIDLVITSIFILALLSCLMNYFIGYISKKISSIF